MDEMQKRRMDEDQQESLQVLLRAWTDGSILDKIKWSALAMESGLTQSEVSFSVLDIFKLICPDWLLGNIFRINGT